MTNSVRGAPRAAEILLYQTEDGKTLLEARFEGETVWDASMPDGSIDPDASP